MRIVDLTSRTGRAVDRFGSIGLTVAPLARQGQAMTATLAAGGRIGRHDAPVDQLLAVVAGRVQVAGHDGVLEEIGAGQAALWTAGESHETRALSDATLVVVEAEGLAAHLA